MATNTSRRVAVAVAVLALCAGSLALRLALNAHRTGVDHGDVSFYVTVARNLVEGRGFTLDYVWNYWHHPESLPTPSNTWWMPLPSVLCAAGMLVFGGDYEGAQRMMIVVAALAPLAVFLLARALHGRDDTALLAAAFAAAFYHLIDEGSAPLSHGPIVLFSALALLCALRAAQGARWLWGLGAGAAVALATLSRSDGIVLLVPVLVLSGSAPRPAALAPARRRLAGFAPLAGGFLLTMLPWWLYNLARFGSPSPGTPWRAALMRNYRDWYALPESVTWQSFRAEGWGAVLRERLLALAANAGAFLSATFSGVGGIDERWVAWGLLAFLLLAWVALLAMLRRRFLFFWTHAAALLLLYSFVFSAISFSSFQTSLFALYPVLLATMAHLVARAAEGASARLRSVAARRAVAGLALAFAGWLLLAQVAYAQTKLRDRVSFIEHLHAFYRPLGAQLAASAPGGQATVLASNVHELHAITGARCVQVPLGGTEALREVAARFGVNLVLVTQNDEPWFQESLRRALADWPGAERVPGPQAFGGVRFELYALR